MRAQKSSQNVDTTMKNFLLLLFSFSFVGGLGWKSVESIKLYENLFPLPLDAALSHPTSKRAYYHTHHIFRLDYTLKNQKNRSTLNRSITSSSASDIPGGTWKREMGRRKFTVGVERTEHRSLLYTYSNNLYPIQAFSPSTHVCQF